MEPDPAFEYDAPTYVDFDLLQQGKMEDDGADEWFDYHVDDEEDHTLGETFDNCFVPAQTPEIKLEECGSDELEVGDDVNEKKLQTPEGLLQSNGDASGVVQGDSISTQTKKWRKFVARSREAAIRCIAPKSSNSLDTPGPVGLRSESKKKQQPKSTEQMQKEEMERLRKEAKKTLRQSRKSFKRLAKTSAPAPIKYSKPPTEAVEFKFKTKERDRGRGSVKPVGGLNPIKFPMTLRSSLNNLPPTPDGVTKVKPFKFQLDSRLNSKFTKDAKKGEFVPMAEAVQQFQKATPPRFHSNAKKAAGVGKSSSRLELTVPKTPKLVSKGRSRPVAVKSAVEKETEEVAKIKEYQFKANPINPGVFSGHGLYGIPKRKAEAATIPVSPHLVTEERIQLRKAQDQPPEDQPGFHAQPMPKYIFENVQGVPEKRLRPLTFPESPVVLKRRKLHEPKEEQQLKPAFKAQLLPHFGTPVLPYKAPILPIRSEPFTLHTEIRGQQHTRKWIEQITEEAKKVRAEAEFKAKEPKSLYTEPFVPQKSSKQLTSIGNIMLNTEMRYEQRAKYDAEKREKDEARNKENLQRRALRETEETKALIGYRRSLVHKAQPIHRYAPVCIKPSDKPLTNPAPPVFVSDCRLRGLATDV